MGYLPAFTYPDQADSPGARHYQDLLDQAAAARSHGDHWAAQQLASAAHKWAMDERIRLQRLTQAQEELARTTKQLERAWDRDRSCTTLAELRERHSEFRHVITSWEAAEERVRVLETPVAPNGAAEEQAPTSRHLPRRRGPA